jgi:hypothetical protein
VLVGRHCEAGRGVSEVLAHDLDRDSLLEQKRGVRVSQVVQA